MSQATSRSTGSRTRLPAVPRQGAAPRSETLPRSSDALPGVEGLPAIEPLDGLGQLTALVRDGFAGLPRAFSSPRRRALWALWLIGVGGDAWTSHAMIASGAFVEGNPLAALGMGWAGMTGYVALTAVMCFFMAVVSTGRPRGPVARVAVAFLLLVCAGKIFMVFNNVLLWRATNGR